MIVSPSSLSGLFQTFDTRFNEALNLYKPKAWWQELAMLIPSKSSVMTHAWMDQLPTLRKWLGERQIRNLSTRGQTVTNELFELTIGVSRSKIEDDEYGVYLPIIDNLGAQTAKYRDQQLKPIIQAGTGSSLGLCYDGQYFFDTDHPVNVDDSTMGTQSNVHTSTALTPANYDKVRVGMGTLKGADGEYMNIQPDTLIVPPQLETVGKMIVGADNLAAETIFNSPATQTQVGANTNPYKGTAKLLVLPELANQATSWYLAQLGGPVKPFLWQERNAPETVYIKNPDDEHVFMKDEWLYGVRARGAAYFALWQLIAKATA
jgi:phage major head subunit gpT-like protein